MVQFFSALCLLASALSVSSSPVFRRGVVPTLSGSAVDMTSGGGGTYPRANFLSDGSIIGAYAATVSGNKQLTLAHSTDNGADWSFLGTAATRPASSSDLDNPYPLQLPSGRVLLAYRNHDKDASTGAYTYFRITISYSDDNGASWLYLSDAVTRDGGALGIWEPLLRVANDGSLQLYYSYENASDDQDNLMVSSIDGGSTFGAPITVSGSGITARDGMTGVASVNSGTLMAVFESAVGGLFTVNSVTSTDDGQTWGNRQNVYTPTGTNNNAGSPQVVNVGGTMCVSFMTDEDTSEHSWVNGADAKLVTSGDGGSTWGNKITVFPVQSNWPGLLTLSDSSFLVMADNDGAKSQLVTLA